MMIARALKHLQSRIPAKFMRLEWLYVVIALGFGLVFIYIIPPGWNADETQHYWRAQQIAHGDLMPTEFEGSNGIIYSGGKLLPDENSFIVSYRIFEGLTNQSLRLNFPAWENEGAIVEKAAVVDTNNVSFPGSARYSPVVYTPQSIGLFIANKLSLPLLWGFVLAKVLGLLVQVAAFAASIRMIPRGKWVIFVLGLLPATVVQSAALGGDVMTTSISVLFIAAIIKLSFDTERVSWWHISGIGTLIALLSLVKPAYLPLAAIVILIPIFNKSFRKPTKIAIAAVSFLVASLPGLLWLRATSFVQDHFSHGVDSIAQQQYVMHEPISFVAALLNTYFTDAQPKLYKNLFGNFVWDTAPLPFVFMLLCVVVMVLALFLSSAREKKFVFPAYVKALFLAVAGILTAVISYALYIYFTKLKDTSILGIQGRYFIPFLPLVGLTLLNPLPLQRQKWLKIIVIGLLVILLVTTIVVLRYRIYT